ncbi:MAG TPA: M23 family metallopeptidase [Thermoanaerobaculia bacterium]|nr:M23 family metallopeptidase [Thermoanaerobaculia bacterium]
MIEIQIHPSDIRRRVRYFFVDRRRVTALLLLSVIVLMFVIASMAAAPSVIRRVYKSTHLRSVRQEQAVQRERLKQHVDQMVSLEKSLDEQRIRIEKLIAVYGLEGGGRIGQGGDASSMAGASVDIHEELEAARRRQSMLEESIDRLQHQIDMLALYESTNADMVKHTPSILPIPSDQFVLTSPFGSRVNPFTRAADFHKGLDLAAPKGTAIFAAADGVVTFSGRYPLRQSVNWWRYGNVVVVNHNDRFITIYAHCDAVNVRPGQQVKQGQTIATVGSTGWSTNDHLHYEVRSDLERPGHYDPIDPRIYILNYQWNNEEQLLIGSRSSKDYKNFDPLPSAFIGRRRV